MMDRNTGCCLIALWTMFYITRLATAKHDHWCSPNMIPGGKCGIHLSELLEGTCGEGNYNSPDYSYRSTQDNALQEERMWQRNLIGKREANIYLKKRRDYYYQGIVCECCINQCSITELRTYCIWNDLVY